MTSKVTAANDAVSRLSSVAGSKRQLQSSEVYRSRRRIAAGLQRPWPWLRLCCAVLCCAGPNLPSARCTYPLAQDQQLFPDDFHFPLKLLRSVCNLKPQQQLGSPRIEQDMTVIVMQLRMCLMHNFATMLPIDKEYIFLLWTAIQ